MKTMTLEQWDYTVGYHLKAILAATDMLESHVAQLSFRPNFEASCEDGMQRSEDALRHALDRVRAARAVYGGKPHAD